MKLNINEKQIKYKTVMKRQITGNCKTQSQGPVPLLQVDGSRLPFGIYFLSIQGFSSLGMRGNYG
jgi:hypothetical protein